MKTSDTEYNIFRDSLLRYAGYANEVGESFRYQFPKLVTPSYMVAFGYCAMDAASTGYSTYEKTSNAQDSMLACCDTLLWQSLASVMIPGATINLIVKASRHAVAQATKLPPVAATWIPTAVGLGSIPFIVHPIDTGVDYLLDNTTRSWM